MPPKRKQPVTGQATAPPAKQAKQDGQTTVSKAINVPVDEGFQEANKVQVYLDDSRTIFDASLNQTNIGGNNNKFYRLQLLETAGKKKQYYVHTRWGRVGEYGQVKTMGPDTLEGSLKEFEKKFKDKAGLTWENRSEEPKPKKYTFIERNYESDDEDADDANEVKKEAVGDEAHVESNLPAQTQHLMELIFNPNHFNSVLLQIGYNANKLPLGKLGKNNLKTGFSHLKELAALIKHPKLARDKYGKSHDEAIEEFSNKYYSTIPHIFGRSVPPLINNDAILRKEVEMLDTLSDMEVAAGIMKVTGSDKKKNAEDVNVLDKQFASLSLSECEPIDPSSQEYKQLSSYLIESSSSGHGINYRVQDIFRIARDGEGDRFDTWLKEADLKDSNRRLLWHGSRTTNFGGILSQGLRIAPPEAPVNGYAFGKGVYMADISTKSAGYCVSSMSGGTGLLLLCEAALSNPIYEIPSGSYNAKEEAEKQNCISTKGVGRTIPLAWKDASCVHEKLKGVLMPKGKPGNNKAHNGGYLEHNEYIVYDIAQIRLRYLFRVDM